PGARGGRLREGPDRPGQRSDTRGDAGWGRRRRPGPRGRGGHETPRPPGWHRGDDPCLSHLRGGGAEGRGPPAEEPSDAARAEGVRLALSRTAGRVGAGPVRSRWLRPAARPPHGGGPVPRFVSGTEAGDTA